MLRAYSDKRHLRPSLHRWIRDVPWMQKWDKRRSVSVYSKTCNWLVNHDWGHFLSFQMEPRKDLLSDIHLGLDLPPCSHKTSLVRGKYDFYHYKCDSFDDVVRTHKSSTIDWWNHLLCPRAGVVATGHCRRYVRGFVYKRNPPAMIKCRPFRKFRPCSSTWKTNQLLSKVRVIGSEASRYKFPSCPIFPFFV